MDGSVANTQARDKRWVLLTFAWLLGASTSVGLAAELTTTNDAKHDTSPPLREMVATAVAPRAPAVPRVHPVRKLPPLAVGRALAMEADTVLQTAATKAPAVTALSVFEGLGLANYQVMSVPSDTTGAVGRGQYVEWVNTAFAVYDKSHGTRILGPVDGNVLWSGFGGNCETMNNGDPIVLYDKLAGRWLLSQFAVDDQPFSECVAISATEDATGAYARYEFQFTDFNDYPKFGIWPDAYYASFNMFHGQSFSGAKACALEREKMLSGQGARMVCADVSNQGGLLPSDMDGLTLPLAGAANVFVNFGVNVLNLWKFHVDWTDTTKSTFAGPNALKVAPFEPACDSCVPQPGVSATLDTLSDRLMFRLAYRRFPDHDALVTNHTVAVGGRTGIRWYEVRDPAGTPSIHDQGTFAPGTLFRWIGTAATDKAGHLALAFNASSKTVSPSMRVAARSATDPHHVLSGEKFIAKGKGAQQSPSRWGDYASITVDPVDDCTFWVASQRTAETGSFDWQTTIAHFRLAGCH